MTSNHGEVVLGQLLDGRGPSSRALPLVMDDPASTSLNARQPYNKPYALVRALRVPLAGARKGRERYPTGTTSKVARWRCRW